MATLPVKNQMEIALTTQHHSVTSYQNSK